MSVLTGAPAVTVPASSALALVAALHAGPAVLSRGAWRRRAVPGLLGLGRPGGVALTFDDGPHPEGTPAVRRQLDRLGVRATFFVLGSQVRHHPGAVAALLADGHEIALHGDEHRNHLTRTPPGLEADLRRARDSVLEDARLEDARLEDARLEDARLEDAGPGVALRFTRPPYGAVTGGTLYAAHRLGLRPVLWSAWGRDWLRRTPEQVSSTVLAGLSADAPGPGGGGGTVLLHDSDCTSTPGSWRATAAALPRIVAAVRDRGWELRRLTEHLPAPDRGLLGAATR